MSSSGSNVIDPKKITIPNILLYNNIKMQEIFGASVSGLTTACGGGYIRDRAGPHTSPQVILSDQSLL